MQLQMGKMDLEVVAPEIPARMMTLVIQPTLLERIKDSQSADPNLQKYVHDPEHVLVYEPSELQGDMSYEEFPVEILAREVRKLRSREIPYVRVRWSNHSDREAT
ncbi:uncharacterized protein LOC109703819 [Ananas comosus]|uniref:Uncharacterized protein LOC109703819 n=1 Tax=Ananas comosus TaxID=4615 RepID=A0A6P5EEQ7_ANACO|nr:uncharacterized protein LOC109703819 [Ananas comosus]